MSKRRYDHFHSAEEEALLAKKARENLAFVDPEFLLREELRPVRLQLELLKPELIMQDENIDSTLVIFGSARFCEPELAQVHLADAERQLQKKPKDDDALEAFRLAKVMVKNSEYYCEARKLARLASQHYLNGDHEQTLYVITGAGPGIMEAANRGAHDVGAKNLGLSIVIPHEQTNNPYVTPELSFTFHYFAIRKMHFLIRAKAMVAFPGGFGTLDEIFDSLTLMQTGKMDRVPLILFDEQYWRKVINFEALVEAGTINEKDLELFTYVQTAEEAWDVIQKSL